MGEILGQPWAERYYVQGNIWKKWMKAYRSLIHKTAREGHTDIVQMKYKSKTGESMVQPCKELKME